MTFNPSSIFVNTGSLSSAQAKRLEQRDEVDVRRPATASRATGENARMVQWLRDAAVRFDARRDDFARGKGATCLDIAYKLNQFGSFASDRQEEFARKLVIWSLPRGSAAPWEQPDAWEASIAKAQAEVRAEPAVVILPRLFDLMQRLSKLTLADVALARKNQDTLCWVKLPGRDGVVGKLVGGQLTVFASRLPAGLTEAALVARLLEVEADPERAAVLHGKASGCCAVCSRDLTDPESIERGIGPICAEKF